MIGIQELLRLVKEQKLVENLCERELTNPEGAGFDLRLGEIYSLSGTAFLGETTRHTPEITKIIEHSPTEPRQITIQPNDYYLGVTIESLNIPINITVDFKPRTSTYRSGLFLRSGNVAPGYHGKITFAIKNEGPVPVTLELGCRIIHAQFKRVEGGGNPYRGQWQGGRVSTNGKQEVQV
jgi:deoxycytidine triphosphate deaminase